MQNQGYKYLKTIKDERWSVGCPPMERRTGRGRGPLQQEDQLRLGEGEGLARGVQQLLRPHRPVPRHQGEDNHLQRVPQPTEASSPIKSLPHSAAGAG